ncbi:uncharacterized protein LOC131214401 [Anopheles bellator]|uniref:uncharacterized protein LOC131214401 n=1 Tax=Anopheles bellator TaxID=139047 RepID=UPI00264784C5|nr:uncharacterized protein LOC131214401 [Anopheles bellator]
MTIPESYRRSPVRGERVSRFEKPRHYVEQSANRGVRIFTGEEKQPKVFCNPVIYDQDSVRRQPYQENDWEDNERSPNRATDRATNSSGSDSGGAYDVRRSVLENALNIAFLAANSNQLRLVTTTEVDRQDTSTYQALLGLLVVSLILQILNCVAMLIMSTHASQRWPLLRTLACVVAFVIALLNLAVVTVLNMLLESD